MFGDNVCDEVTTVLLPPIHLSDVDVGEQVSQNLLQVPGYNPTLNRLALWMLVLTPLCVKIR
jgi:hypothetical protein